MRAVITVAGTDRVGIIAAVTQELARRRVNVMDITQTILPPDLFTMVMLVDVEETTPFGELADAMAELGRVENLTIRAQREDTFNAMHRI